MDASGFVKAKEELRQLIAKADQHRQRKRFDKAAMTWRDEIIPGADDIFDGDSDEMFEERLSIWNEFSAVLTDAREYDEAEDCDALLESWMDSDPGLCDSSLGYQIQNDIQLRIVGRRKAELKTSRPKSKGTTAQVVSLDDHHMTTKLTAEPLTRPSTNRESNRNLDPVTYSAPEKLAAQKPPAPWIKAPKSVSTPISNPATQPSSFSSNNGPAIELYSRPKPRQPKRSLSVTELKQSPSVHLFSLPRQTTLDDCCSTPKTTVPQGRLFSTDDGLDTPADRADGWFKDLRSQTHKLIEGPGNKYKNCIVKGRRYTRVKIAILDTGIAHLTLEEKDNLKTYRSHIKKWRSFHPGEKEGNRDNSGHGTHAAILLLKVCPNADIYIARVARWDSEREEWDIDKKAVIDALKVAVDEWGVDIISMSFGWDKDDSEELNKAISHAREKKALLFAATSNYGISRPNDITYPARDAEVFGIDAADGLGAPSDFNPSSNDETGKLRFSTLGEAVNSKFPPFTKNGKLVGEMRKSGTSFAAPIAAGIAASILEFSRQPPLGFDPSVERSLKKMAGMRRVFRLMSRQKDAAKFKFICPWLLLTEEGAANNDGYHPSTPRFNVAFKIITALREEYGPSIGNAMWKSIMEEIFESLKAIMKVEQMLSERLQIFYRKPSWLFETGSTGSRVYSN